MPDFTRTTRTWTFPDAWWESDSVTLSDVGGEMRAPHWSTRPPVAVALDLEVADAGEPVFLTYGQALRLHEALGEILGLSHPRPTHPITASHPHTGGAKEARNNA